jgi:hypothetical protein
MDQTHARLVHKGPTGVGPIGCKCSAFVVELPVTANARFIAGFGNSRNFSTHKRDMRPSQGKREKGLDGVRIRAHNPTTSGKSACLSPLGVFRAASYFQFHMATLTARRSDETFVLRNRHALLHDEPLLLAVVVGEKPSGQCLSKRNT